MKEKNCRINFSYIYIYKTILLGRVCSVHFKSSHFKLQPDHLKNCFNYSPTKGRKLLPDAVPTENLDDFTVRTEF